VLSIVPIIGWILGGIIGFIISIIEVILVLTDGRGRRLGDKWANTQVVESANMINREEIIDI
jgi:uncharacterized RDD family membrane protein YckC